MIPFTKMHGLGNDFIVIDNLTTGCLDAIGPVLAKKLCDRRFGIGADQILWLKPPKNPTLDARMEILNADGTTAEMCGNGIRAVAIFLRTRTQIPGTHNRLKFSVETLAGPITVQVRGSGESVEVNMGLPGLGAKFATGEEIEIKGQGYRFYEVSMGNPHAVFFIDDVTQFPLEERGPVVEKHPRFPQRTNVEFVQVLGPNQIQVRVWERGSGITLACGTGACAAAVASLATGRVKNPVEVILPGGSLQIVWAGSAKDSVMMTGPATEVFQGVWS